MSNIPTPHIAATSTDQIAKTVLMPGDPLRAKFIADTYLTDVTCFNEVRGMLGFTGFYKGHRVSVMGSGMGIPSALIYFHELFAFYDVNCIIRIGTAGAMQPDIGLRDIVVATASHTNSAINHGRFGPYVFCPTPDFGLLVTAKAIADDLGFTTHFGTVTCGDQFYDEDKTVSRQKLGEYGTLCGEMESAGLYTEARRCGKKALAMFTISDSAVTQAAESSQDRETGYTQMMELALEIALTM